MPRGRRALAAPTDAKAVVLASIYPTPPGAELRDPALISRFAALRHSRRRHCLRVWNFECCDVAVQQFIERLAACTPKVHEVREVVGTCV